MRSILEEMRPDALFCANDYMAAGAIKCLWEAGLRVPQDMSVVPEIAGVASSLFGSSRMIAGAISAELVAFWYDGTPMAMTGTMLLFAAAAFGFWLLVISSVRIPERSGIRRPEEELVC